MPFNEIILFLLVPAFGLYALISVFRRSKKDREASGVWDTFAESRGLRKAPSKTTALTEITWRDFGRRTFESPFVYLPGSGMEVRSGENEGMDFLMEVLPVKKKWINLYDIYTRMVLDVPGMPEDLRLFPETIPARIFQSLDGRDIETGDPDFDRAFVVRGQDPEATRSYLSPGRRASLTRNQSGEQSVFINEGRLFLVVPGRFADFAELNRLFSQVGELGVALKPY